MELNEFLTLLNQDIETDIQSDAWDHHEFADHFFETTREGFLPLHEEIEFLLPHLGEGPFLDLGCGRGRLSSPLREKASGIALDISFASLKGHAHSIQADLRDLPVQGPFSLALMAFGQACFLSREELTQTLKQLKRQLKPEGKIYLDLPTIELMQEMDSQNEFVKYGDWTAFYTRQFEPGTSRLLQRVTLIHNQTSEVKTYSFAYQLYSLYELLELFRELRFRVEYGFEDLDSGPIKETSPWMVFLLQKI